MFSVSTHPIYESLTERAGDEEQQSTQEPPYLDIWAINGLSGSEDNVVGAPEKMFAEDSSRQNRHKCSASEVSLSDGKLEDNGGDRKRLRVAKWVCITALEPTQNKINSWGDTARRGEVRENVVFAYSHN